MDAIHLYKRGHQKWQTGDYDGAISDCTQAIALQPAMMKAYLRRGSAYAASSNFEAALTDYNHIIQHSPGTATAYNNRGNVYFCIDDLDTALMDYSQAIKLDATYSRPYANRALIRSSQGAYAKAFEDFHQALHHTPDYALAYNNRAATWVQVNDKVHALMDIKIALKLDPSNYIYRRNYRLISQMIGGTDTAQLPVIISPKPPTMSGAALPDCSTEIQILTA